MEFTDLDEIPFRGHDQFDGQNYQYRLENYHFSLGKVFPIKNEAEESVYQLRCRNLSSTKLALENLDGKFER